MSGKVPKNSLLATGGSFSLADSFGYVAPLPVLATVPGPVLTTVPGPVPVSTSAEVAEDAAFIGQGGVSTQSEGGINPASFFPITQSPTDDPFSRLGVGPTPSPLRPAALSPASVELAAPTSPGNSPPLTFATPVPQLPPSVPFTPTSTPLLPPSVPLLGPSVPLLAPGPPVAQLGASAAPSSRLKRPIYAPDPFISRAPVSVGPPGPGSFAPPPLGPPSLGTQPHLGAGTPTPLGPGAAPFENLSRMAGSRSSPNLQAFGSGPGISVAGQSQEMVVHWFYRPKNDIWKPFGVDDSFLIEAAYQAGETDPLPVDGTRYDVYIKDRVKKPVYWPDEDQEIRRCSWFNRLSPEGRWVPYEEEVAAKLEAEYTAALQTGQWQRKLVLSSGDWVMLHSPSVMMHFPTSSATHGALDDWGQVQPSSDPALKPRVVHRGLEGLPDIPDSENEEVDHLCFVVHGIGAACDIQFRSIFEVVDNYREMTDAIAAKHFAGARLASRANRVEFLPVNWHSKLHGEEKGTDNRIKPLTLRSIPKLRSFVNDTLLDVLFYTSPIYCQTILDTVCSEINKVYKMFKERNPGFGGEVSLIGHSLGSLILFDLLSGQSAGEAGDGQFDVTGSPQGPVKPRWEKDLSLEEVFVKLGIDEHAHIFLSQGISMAELASCSEEDLKEAELPLGPRKKLINYLQARTGNVNGYQEFQNSAVHSTVDYTIGPAGTGQPSVKYPRLDVQPQAFFAFGSPIGMFMAVRGIHSLGDDFKLPTCARFFNIFHPYDPVAYRIESLVNLEYSGLRPVLIPHHMGRKRMHLELKETMSRMGTDIKQKFLDSMKAVYSMAGTITGATEAIEEISGERDSVSPEPEEDNVTITAQLNAGRRIDYVLQEAPMESFNEYLWSLASHLGYWQSEDTSLLVLKEIYTTRGVQPDDQLDHAGQSTGVGSTASKPPPQMPSSSSFPAPNFTQTFTPTSLPSYPSPLSLPSYPSPPSLPPITMPPGSNPSYAPMYTPASMVAESSAPPTFFSPGAVTAPSGPTRSKHYPRPVSTSGPVIGMDPTASISGSVNPGPPPKIGMNVVSPPSGPPAPVFSGPPPEFMGPPHLSSGPTGLCGPPPPTASAPPTTFGYSR